MNKGDIPDALIHGLEARAKHSKLLCTHPLQDAEKTFQERQDAADFAFLRQLQGVHAPLRLQMERKITLKAGHLPILSRSNASYNSLTGRDEKIEFEDYLGQTEDSETLVHPHVVMERKWGL